MAHSRRNLRKASLLSGHKAVATLRLFVIGILIASVVGCQQDSDSQADQQADKHAEHQDGTDNGHHHVAPHGGALVALGDHLANLEFLLDENTGELTAWALDGCAENPVRLPDSAIECVVTIGDESSAIVLYAVANELTGETVGNTSQFSATSDRLLGVQQFDVSISTFTIKGQAFEDISFGYQGVNAGAEHIEGEAVHTDGGHDHGHDHDDGHDHDH